MAIAENIAKRTKRRRVPWRPIANVDKRASLVARLKKKGLHKPMSKAEARKACDEAAAKAFTRICFEAMQINPRPLINE